MEKLQDLKEQRVRKIAQIYYSRKDILNEIYNFSKNREVSPRYFAGFGKRPDTFQYPSDISALVKKGATSFHCSEELWKDPLELSTDLTQDQLHELRTGWDLIIDIDCKWIDYSKKAAQAIIKALEFRGVKNIGIKFSGSKGFHIIVPWQAFPEQVADIQTKHMFPDWPKAIINYLKELSHPILADMIKKTESDFADIKDFTGIKCEACSNLAQEKYQITLRCPSPHPAYIETFKTSNLDYKKKKCPTCKSELEETSKTKFYTCNHCNLNSLTSPENFNQKIIATDIFKILGLDIQLVSSRHLFRMPYSLHEKTALASIVIDKNQLEKFEIKDADPLNVKIKPFFPQPEKDEAKELLIQAIDWQKTHEIEKPKTEYQETSYQNKKEFEPIKIQNLKEEYFPPTIQKILKGMDDGKKRSLFILLNFFRSLGQSMNEVAKKVNDWNKRNHPPLKQGYIDAQLKWHARHAPVLPPNFNNPIYKEIGVLDLDHLSEKVKNPVNYVVRKFHQQTRKKNK